MTYEEARLILDMLKDGHNTIPSRFVNEALTLTGDLDVRLLPSVTDEQVFREVQHEVSRLLHSFGFKDKAEQTPGECDVSSNSSQH